MIFQKFAPLKFKAEAFPELFYSAIKYYCNSFPDETWKTPAVVILFDEISKTGKAESAILNLFGVVMDLQEKFKETVYSLDCCFTSLSNTFILGEATVSNRCIEIMKIPLLKESIKTFSQILLDKCCNINLDMVLEYLGGHPRAIEFFQNWIMKRETVNAGDILNSLLPAITNRFNVYKSISEELVIPCLLRKSVAMKEIIHDGNSFDQLVASGYYLNSIDAFGRGIPTMNPLQLRVFAHSIKPDGRFR